jgi:predicted permease
MIALCRALLVRLGATGRHAPGDQRLEDEVRLHLELETERNVARGMTPFAARRQARLDFGPIESMKEEHRDGRGIRWIEDGIADVRHALRALRRDPLLATAAIVTLAVGIGTNTAIYSAVHAVILQPLPFASPDRLMMISEDNPQKQWHQQTAAPANYLDWKTQVAAFQDVAAYMPYVNTLTLTGTGEPRVLSGYTVTGNFFSVLGVRAAHGRVFTDAETWKQGVPVVILSDAFWRSQFHADPAVVGRSIVLNGQHSQVVGVMPATFALPGVDADLWQTSDWDPGQRTTVSFRRAHYLRAVARLKPGVSFKEADAQLQVVVGRLQQQYPQTNEYMGAELTPLQRFLVGNTRQPLLVLLAAVGVLLLLACANVSNLVMVQAIGRARETAVRLALGARAARLARKAITESLVLSSLGGAAGLALGWAGTHALVALQPSGLLPVHEIPTDWSVVAFVVAITTVSGLLFGIAPVLWNRKRIPGEALRQGTAGAGIGGAARRWGNTLVIGEVALALLLALGAGLLVRSFGALLRVSPGFDADGVITVSMNIPDARYDSASSISGFYDRLIRRVDGIAGVQSAAVVSSLPLTGGVGWTSDFTAAGRPADGYGNEVAHRAVSPDYFRTMRVPLLSGRAFTNGDVLKGSQVVVVNRALAQSYFKGQDPVGQRIVFDKVPDSTSTWRTIVGVVGDERQTDLATQPQIEIIAPQSQQPSTLMTLVARTAQDPMSVVPAIRAAVHDLDATVGLTSVQTMTAVRAQSIARQRFLMTLLSGLAIAGLVLATVGVYGVMARLARLRTRELGIRLALGATRQSIEWMVVREGVALATIGMVIGIAAALVICRLMTALLFGVTPADPVTFVGATVLLFTAALAASWIPALRAGRTDPMTMLRAEA